MARRWVRIPTAALGLLAWALCGGCGEAREDAGAFVLVGGIVDGHGPAALRVGGGTILAIGETPSNSALPVHDISGHYVVPSVIDSHVHLSFAITAEALARGGVAAAVDLAAPLSFLDRDPNPLRLIRAGPMVTAAGGYPTQSWGRDGYGFEVSSPDAARRAVDQLFERGARVIKVPVGDPSGGGVLPVPKNEAVLGDAALEAIVTRAHERGLKVAAHALTDAAARRAAQFGADVLAHTPARPLAPETLRAWSGRAVISTLAALEGRAEAVENLRQLRAAGALVLYGTDLGYTDVPGIHPGEIEGLGRAGLDGPAVLDAATREPAAFWGLAEHYGALEVGRPASFLVLARDPRVEPDALAEPVAVYLDGERLPPRDGGSD